MQISKCSHVEIIRWLTLQHTDWTLPILRAHNKLIAKTRLFLTNAQLSKQACAQYQPYFLPLTRHLYLEQMQLLFIIFRNFE